MDSAYEKILKRSQFGTDPGQSLSFQDYSQEDTTTSDKPVSTEKAAYSGAGDAAKTLQQGGSGADALASGLTGAGVASANPYMVGAGLGLSVLSAGEKRKRQEEMNAYTAALAQNQARRDAIDTITRVYQGQKGLF